MMKDQGALGLRNKRRTRLQGFRSLAIAAAVATPICAQAQIQFSDETANAGLFYVGETRGAAFVDYNGDLFADIFQPNHRLRSNFYRNNGDGTFTNVILQIDGSQTWTGLLKGNDTHGAAFADLDNDGDPDVYHSTGTPNLPYLMINHNGVFFDEATARNIEDDQGGWMGTWFDYNRDGLLDLMTLSINITRMMRQNGDGTFTKVNGTDASGSCPGSDWAHVMDLNDDGIEEIVCMQTHFAEKIFDIVPTPFTDITATQPTVGLVVDSITGDFNNDLLQDTFLVRGRVQPAEAVAISNDEAEAYLTVSNDDTGFTVKTTGDLTVTIDTKQFNPQKVRIGDPPSSPASLENFTVTTADVGIPPYTPGVEVERGAYIGYFPTEGEYRIFLNPGTKPTRAYFMVQSSAPITEVTEIDFNSIDGPHTPQLLMNVAGVLQPEAAIRGFTEKIDCKSVSTADFDNDGDLDLFVACGKSVSNLANRLYENDGNGNFTEVVNFGGEGVIGAGVASNVGAADSVITADYDLDGFVDALTINGARLRPTNFGGPDQLFRNTTSNNNEWIQVHLVGTVSNRDAQGAKLIVTEGASSQLREQNGGYHRWSQDYTKLLHFGFGNLGANPSIDTVRVEWPSGFVDEFQNVAANKFWRITEGATSGTGTIEEVVPGPVVGFPAPQPGDECGQTAFDPAQDAGIYLTRDCTNDIWRIEVTAGGNPTNVITSGIVDSDSGFSFVQGVNLEAADSVDANPDPEILDFTFKTKNKNVDELDFTVAPGATEVCLSLTSPAGTQEVYVGPLHRAAQLPLNLIDFGACTPPAGSAEIGDYVWEDLNSDGIQDAGEPGRAGVTVNLQDCTGALLDSTVTDGNGKYLFGTLPGGDYQVEFIAPAGFFFSPDKQGPKRGQDSDPDPDTGVTKCTTVAEGQSKKGLDAGLTTQAPPSGASLGDFVWNDTNGDGIQDAGEPGQPGVTVNLQDCASSVLDTTVTGANGEYLFTGLAAGDYVIEFVLPGGFVFSPKGQGPKRGQDSDADPVTGLTGCKTLVENQDKLGMDAGLVSL